MRRIAALLLVVTSGWLLYQTSEAFIGQGSVMSTDLFRTISNPKIFVPLAGGFMGLLGGLLVFFGGAGGAAIALIGGLLSAGFALSIGQKFTGQIWENELAVGLVMLGLAACAALMGRD